MAGEAVGELKKVAKSYKRGGELLLLCRSRLAAVEEQVRVLEDGQLEVWNPPTA